MPSESSPNSYYRYKIYQAHDLSLETFLRRLQKAERNKATHILFDWCHKDLNLNIDFVKINRLIQNSTFFQFEHLLTQDQAIQNQLELTAENKIHIQIQNFHDFEKLNSIYDHFKIIKALHLAPETLKDLNSFLLFTSKKITPLDAYYFWNIPPYNSQVKNSLTTSEVGYFFAKNNLQLDQYLTKGILQNIEIWNSNIPADYELESLQSITWSFKSKNPDPKLSVVIPSFNNLLFLSQVLTHLFQQSITPDHYEIIVIEDGGQDQTSEIIQSLFAKYKNQINLKFIYWSKHHSQKGSQNFFRAGLARNLGVHYSESDYLMFLDSDMLVPYKFIEIVLNELQNSDLIQFQRYHIHQAVSLKNPCYDSINIKTQTYIEEQNYWSHFFNSNDWSLLPNYWKYTCTYALGLKKNDFYRIGRFKKYYVSYGFEDTDIGYRMFKLNKKFKLIKTPLMHLTAYDKMQYQNSAFKRVKLLKKTCALFYLQHLNQDIFQTFQNFFRFEKSFLKKLKELF